MNTISIIGRLTADPELRKTQSGIAVASFTLAVDRPRVKETTDFFRCVAWRQTGEFVAQYFTKGRKMGVTGSMQSRQYEDKDGNKRTVWEVVADQVDFCDSKKNTDGPSWAPDDPANDDDPNDPMGFDLPF